MLGVCEQLKSYRVEVLISGQWQYWQTIKAFDREHAESILYARYRPSRFRIAR